MTRIVTRTGNFKKNKKHILFLNVLLGNLSSCFAEFTVQDVPVAFPTYRVERKAYRGCLADQVIIPDGVTFIDKMAFADCPKLEEVLFPETLQDIENSFVNCMNLSEIDLSSAANLQSLAGSFEGCTDLKEITLPEKLQEIGDGSFKGCSNLNSVSGTPSLKFIGADAFKGTSIEKTPLLNEVEYIGPAAFETKTPVLWDFSDVSWISVPNGVEVSSDQVEALFQKHSGASGLMKSNGEMFVNPSVTIINDTFFKRCPWKEEVETLVLPKNLQSIQSLKELSHLKNLNCPEGHMLSKVSSSIFNASSLSISKTFIEPLKDSSSAKVSDLSIQSGFVFNGVKFLSPGTLKNCKKLKSVSLPVSLEKIGSEAFYNCTSLKEIDLPFNVNEIERSAFEGCTGIASLVFPESLQDLGEKAFSNCINLSKLCGVHQISQLNENCFENCPKLGVLQIFSPDGQKRMSGNVDEDIQTAFILQGTESLKDRAFYFCYSLKNVALPLSLKTLGDSVFYGCSSLNSIDLPSSLLSLGRGAFSCCYGLKSITLPESLTAIDDFCFYDCRSIESLTLPSSLQTIGQYAFSGVPLIDLDVSKLSRQDLEQDFTASFSMRNLKSLTVSEKTAKTYVPKATNIKDLKFVCRGYEAGGQTNLDLIRAFFTDFFSSLGNNYPNLSSITVSFGDEIAKNQKAVKDVISFLKIFQKEENNIIFDLTGTGISDTTDIRFDTSIQKGFVSDGVKILPAESFKDCELLESVRLPESLKKIDTEAFYNCRSLKSLDLPSGVEEIASYAFSECSELDSFTFSESLKKLGEKAFSDCTKLEKLCGLHQISHLDKNCFENCPKLGTLQIFSPDGQKRMSGNVDEDIKTALILQGTESLKDRAFYFCYSLKNVALPLSLKTLGDSVFYGCSSLNSIDLPSSLLSLGRGAFSCCYGLKSITLPESLTAIDDFCFYDCRSIESLTLPSSLQTIGQYAFSGTPLIDLDVSNLSRQDLEQDFTASFSMRNLKSLTISEKTPKTYVSKATNITDLNFVCRGYEADGKTSVELIQEFFVNFLVQLKNYPNLSSITVSFGEGVVRNRSFLKKILPFLSFLQREEKRLVLDLTGTGAWLNDFDASEASCLIQTGFVLNGMKALPFQYFKDCQRLESVCFLDSLEKIGSEAFYNCTALKEIDLPFNVNEIERSAFEGCTGIASLVFPESLQDLGEKAFSNCINLSKLCGVHQISQLNENCFENCPKLGVLQIFSPDGQKRMSGNVDEDIQTAFILQGTESLKDRAFYFCYSLKNVALPLSLKTLGDSVFYGCSSLNSIDLPSSLQSLGRSAFSCCYGLKSITLPESLTAIDDFCFYDCRSIESLTLPSSLQTIGQYAFSGVPLIDLDVSKLVSHELDQDFTASFSMRNLKSLTVSEKTAKTYVPKATNIKDLKFVCRGYEANGKTGIDLAQEFFADFLTNLADSYPKLSTITVSFGNEIAQNRDFVTKIISVLKERQKEGKALILDLTGTGILDSSGIDGVQNSTWSLIWDTNS